MSAGTPELGSKISLISKADIRYEGRLFTVDPKQCTIALANVRSFGTEDRETQHPIAPRDQMYAYILFRGSDIKDIRVVNNVGPLPNDSAIVPLSDPPSIGSSAHHQTAGFSHPVVEPMGQGLSQYSTCGAMGAMTELPSAVAPCLGLHPRSLIKQPDLLSESRSTTPSLVTGKFPTIDQGVQVNQPNTTPVKEDKKEQQLPQVTRQVQPPQPARDGQANSAASDQNKTFQSQRRRDQQPHSRDQVPAPLPQRIPRGQSRGGWVNWGGMRRGRGWGGSTGTFNRPGRQQFGTCGKPKNILKFEYDYDFEQANTEFEELRSQLTKIKIEDSEPIIAGDGKVNGESDKKDDSGNETGVGEGEQEEEPEVYYDKSKSFFDNISCEAVERSKGRSQKTDWRTERKLNTETFGVASARRGGYRGRGYYGNRGMGGMYRGNYRGGCRMQGQCGGRSTTNSNSPAVNSLNNSQPRRAARSRNFVRFQHERRARRLAEAAEAAV